MLMEKFIKPLDSKSNGMAYRIYTWKSYKFNKTFCNPSNTKVLFFFLTCLLSSCKKGRIAYELLDGKYIQRQKT